MRTNLATNPSVESATTGWTAVPGTTGVAAITNPTATTTYGTLVARCTWSTANTAVGAGISYDVAVTAGTIYSFFLGLIRPSLAQTLQFQVEWRTASATISTSTATAQAFTAGQALSATLNNLTAPATATIARVKVLSTVGLNSIGSTLDLDGLLVEAATAVGAYFDGSTSGGYWTGTVNASTSVFPTTTPTLTAVNDSNPCPRVQIVFTEFPPTINTINVYRVAEGRQFKVRGGVNLFAIGGAALVDYEAPFGVPAVYRAEMFDASNNSLGFTTTATVTLTVTDSWIHQPLSPTLAVKVRVFMDSANDLTRPSPGQVTYPEGATVGTLIGGQRRGLSQMALNVRLFSTADADELLSMWGSYTTDFPAVVCVRTPPPLRIPRTLFAGSLAPHEVIVGVNAMLTYQMVVDEVAPPSAGLIIPLLRRNDIDAAFTTRAARAAAYATRILRDTDYSKSGLSGP